MPHAMPHSLYLRESLLPLPITFMALALIYQCQKGVKGTIAHLVLQTSNCQTCTPYKAGMVRRT